MELQPWIYNALIDPLLKSMRHRIKGHVKPGMKVLDVACGTGQLAREMAGAGMKITAIDLEPAMIGYSLKRLNGMENPNLSFMVSDALSMDHFEDKSFDVAILSLALHQFAPKDWDPVLREILRITRELIIADYHYPLPPGALKKVVYIIERIAGKEHSDNFRSFMNEGGVVPIIRKSGLQCTLMERSGSGIFGLYRVSFSETGPSTSLL